MIESGPTVEPTIGPIELMKISLILIFLLISLFTYSASFSQSAFSMNKYDCSGFSILSAIILTNSSNEVFLPLTFLNE